MGAPLRHGVVVALSVLAFGCAAPPQYLWTPAYDRPMSPSDYTPERFAQDRWACLSQSQVPDAPGFLSGFLMGLSRTPVLLVGPVGATTDERLFRACMEARGWTVTMRP